MKKLLLTLLPFAVILVIIVFVAISAFGSDLPFLKQYHYVKQNINTPTEISFWKNPLMPTTLGQKETTLFSFEIKTNGPGTVKFNQGDDIKITLYAQNNSKKNMEGKSPCILRDQAHPTVIYATVDDWTAETRGPGVPAGQYKIADVNFTNFGVGQNQPITIQPNASVSLDLVCDTTNFIKSANPSTLSAKILVPNSIIYDFIDIVSIKRNYITGTAQNVSGLPISGQELSTEE